MIEAPVILLADRRERFEKHLVSVAVALLPILVQRPLSFRDLQAGAGLAVGDLEAVYRGAMLTFAPLDHAEAVREARAILQAISPSWREAFAA